MRERKIILFIVEGVSDEAYISPIKKEIDKKYGLTLSVRITYGDITSNINSNHKSNILEKIRNEVNMFLNSHSLKISDIKEIVHIIDIDYVYCENNDILLDEKSNHITYFEDRIETKNPKSIIKRNENKRKILSILSAIKDGINFPKSNYNVPYKAYYFSQNIDHVFYNVLNSTDEEKEENSLNIAYKYRNNFKNYVDVLNSNSFVGLDYNSSWKEISKTENAFKRKTNLNLFVDNYK